MGFKATWDSVKTHQMPDWFQDAKFGIFIHWGIYSVPAFAPTKTAELGEIPGDEGWYCNNPYAEWYFNSINVKKGPTWEHHCNVYGEDFAYENFLDHWRAEKWDPLAWARLFKEAGAQYVVLTTKHHDGFCLYPSKYTDYHAKNYGPKRDIMGELTEAVRSEGLKMGAYYSGLLDWKHSPFPILNDEDHYPSAPQTYAYADYAFSQVAEIIDHYKPSVLWNDIGWPLRGEEQLPQLLATYYNTVADGVVNDRWNNLWSDYVCTEYKQGQIPEKIKWEHCRGLGLSFGINKQEDESDYLSKEDLLTLLVQTVSTGGNLLLNIGPNADGTIHPIQIQRLKEIGEWLSINGGAIYGTRPHQEFQEKEGMFGTIRDGQIYLIIDCRKKSRGIRLPDSVRNLKPLDPDVRIDLLDDELNILSRGKSSSVICFEVI